jgi:hypothetical protein
MNPGEAQVLTVRLPDRSWAPGATPEEAAVPEPVGVTAAPMAEAMGFSRDEEAEE